MEVLKELLKDIKVTPITLRVLMNRGIDTKEKADEFLNSSLNKLYNPYLMKDMDKAIEIMVEAINNKEKIMVYGDYCHSL